MNTKISKNSNDKKKKKVKFKMPSSLMIIVGVLFFFIVFTWILSWTGANYEVPTGGYNPETGEFIPDGGFEIIQVIPVGLLGFGNAIAEGFGNAYSLIFYLFVLGALIEILLVTGTLESGVGSLVKGLNGKEILLIPIMFVLFSAGGTVYGMQEESIGLFIIVVPALVLAGFDTITGLLVILLGTTTGFAMSTVNPFAVGAAEGSINDALNNSDLNIIGAGLVFRLIWWVILTAVGAIFMTGYAHMVKKDNKYSFNSQEKIQEDKKWIKENFNSIDQVPSMTGRQKISISLFMSLFVFMILMMVPWPDLFNYAGIESMNWPVWISWLFNWIAQPGEWYFGELIMLFSLGTLLIVAVLKIPMSEASKTAWEGAKAMFSVAILIGVARAIPQVLGESGMQIWMVQSMTSGLNGMQGMNFIYMMVPILFKLAMIIPSTSGLAGAVLPIITGAAISTTGGVATTETLNLMSGVMIVFLLMVGFANMFIPTQSVVMAQMDASHVSYITALKPIGIYIGIMMVITLVAIIPTTVIFLM